MWLGVSVSCVMWLGVSVPVCHVAAHHFGFEAAAWYWHFVDVVWLFLYLVIYWWSCGWVFQCLYVLWLVVSVPICHVAGCFSACLSYGCLFYWLHVIWLFVSALVWPLAGGTPSSNPPHISCSIQARRTRICKMYVWDWEYGAIVENKAQCRLHRILHGNICVGKNQANGQRHECDLYLTILIMIIRIW